MLCSQFFFYALNSVYSTISWHLLKLSENRQSPFAKCIITTRNMNHTSRAGKDPGPIARGQVNFDPGQVKIEV